MTENEEVATLTSLWLRDDLEEVYALLFRFLGYGFRLAMSNVGWLVTQKFVILVPDPTGLGPWSVLLGPGEPCDSCCRSECGLLSSFWRFPFVPSPITSPSAAEAARGGEREGRLRLDEEVLDAPKSCGSQSSEWEERKKSRVGSGSLCEPRTSRKTIALFTLFNRLQL